MWCVQFGSVVVVILHVLLCLVEFVVVDLVLVVHYQILIMGVVVTVGCMLAVGCRYMYNIATVVRDVTTATARDASGFAGYLIATVTITYTYIVSRRLCTAVVAYACRSAVGALTLANVEPEQSGRFRERQISLARLPPAERHR